MLLRTLAVLLLLATSYHARTLTDMAGNTITLDAPLEKVFGSSPPTTYLVALFKPEALIGLNIPLDNQTNHGSKVLDPRLKELPILKGWHGAAGGSSAEVLLARGTQAIIAWNTPFLNGMIEKSLHGAEIPVIYIEPDDMARLPATFRFLGGLFEMPERGEALALYAEAANARLASLRHKVTEPKRVYYALGPKGLASECDNSFHATFIEAAGGVNVNHCEQSALIGMEQVSFESVLAWQPDAIVVQDPVFFERIFKEPGWKMLKAVQAGAVYYVPKTPINWLDRPPSFMRLIGAQWLASKLYPGLYGAEAFDAETKTFFERFFGTSLEGADYAEMFRP